MRQITAQSATLCLFACAIACGSTDSPSAASGGNSGAPNGAAGTVSSAGSNSAGMPSAGSDNSGGDSPVSMGGSSGAPEQGGENPGTAGTAGAAGMGGGTTNPPPSSNRVDVLLDDGWKFIKQDVAAASGSTFDDSAWGSVTLPHTWNLNDATAATYYQGPGWYRRHYTVPAAYAGRRLYLQFDGVNKVADVYVNGTRLGQHRGGNAMFRFDATSALKVGADNVIAVKADNSAFADVAPLSPDSAGPDFTQFGGAYRDAHLLVTDPVHIDVLDYSSPGVFITPKAVTAASASLDVKVELVNDDTAAHTVDLEVQLLDASGQTVQTLTKTQAVPPSAAGKNTPVTLTATVASPHLWNGRVDPYVYTVRTLVKEATVVRDALDQPTGFRFFSIDPNSGFSLNGKYLDLHGVNRHQESGSVGWALKAKNHDEDMALMAELGANMIRLAHYQQSQYMYDLSDRQGMVIWAELGIVHLLTASTAFTQNAQQQLTELIRQSYNHPSILFWSLSNELTGSGLESLMNTLNALAHSEDPSRQTLLADNASTWDTKASLTDGVGFNYYNGWYAGAYTDIGGFLDGLHQAKGNRGFGMSEFGAGAEPTLHSENPAKKDYTEEYQCLYHEAYWNAMKTRPFVWHKLVWTMFDFPSSYRAGAAHENGINNKGLVTHDRKIKKDAFYWFKANWSSDPFVHINGSRFTSRNSASTTVKVYANTDSVELKLNGTSIGSKTSASHVFSWPVTLSKGSNKVEVVGTKGAVSTYIDSATWTLN